MSQFLRRAIASTFSNRGTTLRPIEFDETSCKALQKLWSAHFRSIGDNAKELSLPQDIAKVMEEINLFVAERIHANSEQALQDLIEQAQMLNLGY